jgi:proline iminopeptidase
MDTFRAATPTGDLVGTVGGEGPPVLLLHGGPGLSDYLGLLADELRDAYTVATYTQRGLAPSTEDGAMDVASHVADALRVADHLGWDRPVLGGHSWGGHLTLHVIAAHPERFAAALVIDPLGAVGDGTMAEFVAAIEARVPPANLPRLAELDVLEKAGPLPSDLLLEQLRLAWPAYFADPATAPEMPAMGISPRQDEVWSDMLASLPALESRLAGCLVPTAFVHGALSPIPVRASTESAAVMRDATVDVVPDCGHFIWLDAPGAVRRSLDALRQRLS